MSNAYLPRDQVHAWSDAIGNQSPTEQSALARLLKQQRRLTKWLEENAGNMELATAQVSVYLFGVLARMFDLAGGRLGAVSWEQIRAAEAKVGAVVGQVLPSDDGFAARVRIMEWRAQPHILDEALLALFEREPGEDEPVALSDAESAKVFFMMWVATEALDASWHPPKGFAGETEYAYVHIEPTPPAAIEGTVEA